MKSDGNNSAASSDATSPSEADPLRHEADLAQAAIVRQLDEIKTRLESTGDVRDLIKRHPWLSMATATAAGFVAARVVLSPHAPVAAATPPDRQPVEPQTASAAVAPWWTSLIDPLFDLLKTVIERLVRQWLTERRHVVSDPDSGPASTTAATSNAPPASEAQSS